MMNSSSNDPSAVSFSTSLYELLLATYPSRFRHEYGPHMAQVSRDRNRERHSASSMECITHPDWHLVSNTYYRIKPERIMGEH